MNLRPDFDKSFKMYLRKESFNELSDLEFEAQALEAELEAYESEG